MFASMFFRYAYGPWGGEISHFKIIYHNLTWQAWPMLLLAWPMAFGLLEASFAVAMIIRGPVSFRRYHCLTEGIFLATIATLQLGLIWWHGGMANFLREGILLYAVSSGVVLTTLCIGTRLIRGIEGRSQMVSLLGTSWALLGLIPVSGWTNVETTLAIYGMGYWMLLTGALVVFVVNICGWSMEKKDLVATQQQASRTSG